MEIELPLTDHQENALSFIAEFIYKNRYPPTVKEIQEGVGYSNPGSVYRVLEGLENKNYIEKEKNVARGIRLTELGEKYLPSDESETTNDNRGSE